MAEDDPVSGAGGPTLRLFVAVEVPRSAARAVAAAIRPWREELPSARWVPPENWHLTLKFLGRTPADLTAWVEETVGGIVATHPPLTARVRGLGAFPSARRARVLWAGIDDPANGLADLVTELESGLATQFRAEIRRFHPHLTVARSEPPLSLPESYGVTPLVSEPFVADRVVLFRSHLHGGSPQKPSSQKPWSKYEPIRTFALEG